MSAPKKVVKPNEFVDVDISSSRSLLTGAQPRYSKSQVALIA